MGRAGIFGWSYPPGCSGPPDDGPEPPCQVCGEYEEKCTCTECKAPVKCPDGSFRECGTVGCLEHMGLQALIHGEELFRYLAKGYQNEIHRRNMAAAVACDQCGKMCPAELRDTVPPWCDKCEAFAQKEARENC